MRVISLSPLFQAFGHIIHSENIALNQKPDIHQTPNSSSHRDHEYKRGRRQKKKGFRLLP